jgi:hypothetical protein
MNDEQVYLFRPGEERRLLARMQFGLHRDGKCGAIFTYPIPGHPWRHNVIKTDSWQIDTDLADSIFKEVQRLPAESPRSCIPYKMLWADHSEKANSITRDRDTYTLCFTIGIVGAGGDFIVLYAMKESEPVLLGSTLFRTASDLTRSLEKYQPWKRSEQSPPANPEGRTDASSGPAGARGIR